MNYSAVSITLSMQKKREKGKDWNVKNLDSDKKSTAFGEKKEKGSSVIVQRLKLSKLLYRRK